jgi:hypothetical protein
MSISTLDSLRNRSSWLPSCSSMRDAGVCVHERLAQFRRNDWCQCHHATDAQGAGQLVLQIVGDVVEVVALPQQQLGLVQEQPPRCAQ